MTKEELKKILQLYSKIYREVHEGRQEVIIELYGRKHFIKIPVWAGRLEGFIQEIILNEKDEYFSKIIIDCYLKGRKDKSILSDNPISESTYYRWKRRFEDKIYQLFILEGVVSKNEIINNKISR